MTSGSSLANYFALTPKGKKANPFILKARNKLHDREIITSKFGYASRHGSAGHIRLLRYDC